MKCVCFLLLTARFTVFAQSTAPAFEAASIKAVDVTKNFVAVPKIIGPERFQGLYSVRLLIQWAYNLKDYQLLGGPEWSRRDYFEIQAVTGRPSTEDQIRQMAQQLLETRFKLKLHRETREIQVFGLHVGKNGFKLPPAKDSTKCGGKGCFGVDIGSLTASGATMASIADTFSLLLDHPCLDQTGLNGNYDFKLSYDQSSVKQPIPAMPITQTEGPSFFTAVQDLGLRLDLQRTAVEMLVVDSVDHPLEN